MTNEFCEVTKITSRISVPWTHSLPFCFSHHFLTERNGHIIKSKCECDNFESHNFPELSFTNTWSKSFLKLKSPDTLALCETNLEDSSNFFVRDYLLFGWISLLISMVLQLWEGGSSFCTGLFCRKLWGFLITFSTSFTSFYCILFLLSITVILFMQSFWCYFMKLIIWGLLRQSICKNICSWSLKHTS